VAGRIIHGRGGFFGEWVDAMFRRDSIIRFSFETNTRPFQFIAKQLVAQSLRFLFRRMVKAR
jgi:hypothetical protein